MKEKNNFIMFMCTSYITHDKNITINLNDMSCDLLINLLNCQPLLVVIDYNLTRLRKRMINQFIF
jgi:hypothetical protein